MTGTGFAYEVPVWEPSTEGPAIESVPWARSSADVRRAAVRVWGATVVLGVTFWWVWGVGASWVAVVLLGLATVVGMLLSVVPVVLAVSARRDWGLLGTRSWRRATVRVFSPGRGEAGLFGGETRLLVDGDTERAMWLSWSPASWVDQQVLARTGRIWLVGPDSEDRVLFCSAGCAVANCTAEVLVDNDGEAGVPVRAEQVEPARLPSAGDDVVASAALASCRRTVRLGWYGPVAALVPAVAVLVVLLAQGGPRAWEAVAGVGIVVAMLAAGVVSGLSSLARVRRMGRLLRAGPWTAVPVVVEPGTKLVDRDITVRLSAILTDGHARSVSLKASYPLTANIADTGQLWVAGEPAAGRIVAAGLPGYPFVSIAHIGH